MNRFWTLSGKPLGAWPEADTLRCAKRPSRPGPGQALTRTIYVSLDPYQWGYKKRGVEAPGAPCHARTVAQVIESRMDGFARRRFRVQHERLGRIWPDGRGRGAARPT